MAKAKKKSTPKKAAPVAKKVKEVVKEKPAKKYEIPACKHENTKKVRNHRNVTMIVCADCGIRV